MAKKYCNKHYCCYEAKEGCVYCEPEDLVGQITITKISSAPLPTIRAWWHPKAPTILK